MEEKAYGEQKNPVEESHQGRNLQRIRIYLGIKQETLANELGFSQPQVSTIESQAVIDEKLLQNIATVLGISPEIIKDFDLERAIYNINNSTIHNGINHGNRGSLTNSHIVNPLDKVVELYERLLVSEREKLDLYLNQRSNS